MITESAVCEMSVSYNSFDVTADVAQAHAHAQPIQDIDLFIKAVGQDGLPLL